MPLLALASLDPHPHNSNRMPRELMMKLAAHIQRTGEYPPLIVRPFPAPNSERFQILDGHHRVQILRDLGYEQARCEIWHVDDAQAAILLLTLNRLHGEDDPQRRGALLAKASHSIGIEQLAKLVPENIATIHKLMELTCPAPEPATPTQLDDMPQAVTFFLTGPQCKLLFDKLREFSADRSRALVELLHLERSAFSFQHSALASDC